MADPFYSSEASVQQTCASLFPAVQAHVGALRRSPNLTADLERQTQALRQQETQVMKMLSDMRVAVSIISQERAKFPQITDAELSRRQQFVDGYMAQVTQASDSLTRAYNEKSRFAATNDRKMAAFDAEMGYQDRRAQLAEIEDQTALLVNPLQRIKQGQRAFSDGLAQEEVLLDDLGNVIDDAQAKGERATKKVTAAQRALQRHKDCLFLGGAVIGFLVVFLLLVCW